MSAPDAGAAVGPVREAPWQVRWNTLRRRSTLLGKMARRPLVAVRPCRYLFVLSHMRSRSTLLAHLLGSHPEISGHLETHIRYRRRRDFHKLRYAVSDAEGGAPLARYAMDKILHHWYVDLAVADRMDVLPVFLVREPEEALPSLRHFVAGRRLRDALRHYGKQLRWLETAAQRLHGEALFVRSESIVDETDRLLAFLGDALGLATPLSPRYAIFDATGTSHAGDPSKRIRTGRVLHDRAERRARRKPVPPAILAPAREAYDACVETLERRCRHLPRPAAAATPPRFDPCDPFDPCDREAACSPISS